MLEVIIRRGEAHDEDDDGGGGYDHCYEDCKDYNGYDHYQDYQDYRIVARMRIMMELSGVIIVMMIIIVAGMSIHMMRVIIVMKTFLGAGLAVNMIISLYLSFISLYYQKRRRKIEMMTTL